MGGLDISSACKKTQWQQNFGISSTSRHQSTQSIIIKTHNIAL